MRLVRAIREDGDGRCGACYLASAYQNFVQVPGPKGFDFHGDLVRLDLEQRFTLLDPVAGLLEPAHDFPLGDGLPEVRHDYFVSHSSPAASVCEHPVRG